MARKKRCIPVLVTVFLLVILLQFVEVDIRFKQGSSVQGGALSRRSASIWPLDSTKAPDRIIFNRIPKSGSTALLVLIAKLSMKNKFNKVHSKVYDKESISVAQQESLVKEVMRKHTPMLFDRHINFIDFNRFNHANPIYINVVREPMERIISDYYFLRYHRAKMFRVSQTRINTTYDQCVERRLPECVADHRKGYYRIIPFFCGQDSYCSIPSERSLEQAKRNVEKYFPVVGLAERLPEFVEAMERLYPSYFKGALQLFLDSEAETKEKYKTKKKILPSSKTMAYMKDKLQYDYNFYEFIEDRFNRTLNTLRAMTRL